MNSTATTPRPIYRDASWTAINGHLMEGREKSYDGGKTWRSEGWSAGHSDQCPCWSSEEGHYEDGLL